MEIDSKNIIVTGASSGFGKALIDKLVTYNNVHIIAVARNVGNIPVYGNVIGFAADLSEKDEVDRLFNFALTQFATIDIFVACAGFGYYEKMEKADWQHIENIFELNVVSPIYSLQRMAELQNGRPLSFVLLASAGGLVALPGFALYSSTKFALNGFAYAYRYEKDNNVKLTVVYPVAAYTNFFKRSASNTPVPFPRQSVDAVVNSIIKGIKTGRRKMYPSKLFRYAYPVFRAFPFIISLFQRKQANDLKKWLQSN